MTRSLDADRLLDDWLLDGPDELADAVLDRVAAEIEAMPQARSRWWSGRSVARFAVPAAAVAVILAAAIGLGILARGTVGAPSPAPSGTPAALIGDTGRLLDAGTYAVGAPFPVPLTLTVPDGWQLYTVDASLAGICRQAACDQGMSFWIVDNLPVDGCRPQLGELDPAVGPAARDLAAALVNQPGYDAVGPIATTVSGFDGWYLQLTTRGIPDGGCSLRTVWTAGDHPRASSHDEQQQIWVVEVGDVRLVIDAFAIPDTAETTRAELRAMVESIVLVAP